jgi:putative phosphoesterase
MIKLGLISDIHGDIESLQAALEFLQRQQVDQIICAGDLIGKGPDENSVVSLIRDTSIACVAGNHDSEWKDSLSQESIEFLKQLPQTLTLRCDTLNVLVTHGAPWSNIVYIRPNAEKHVFRRITYETSADVVILGHTHLPMAARVRNVRIYNPGSVCGKHTGGSQSCAILTLPDYQFEVFKIHTGHALRFPYIELIR